MKLELLSLVEEGFYPKLQDSRLVRLVDTYSIVVIDKRSSQLSPENPELRFWEGVTLLNHGELERGASTLRLAFRANRDLRELLGRLPRAGLLSVDKETLAKLLKV